MVRVVSSEGGESRLTPIQRQFDGVPEKPKNKLSFHNTIAEFKDKRSRAHVEFINSALSHVKEYGVHKDLDTYKALLNIFPKGKMIPQNVFQRIMLHYPQQQNCCVKVLDEMEWHGVNPDKEIHDIVVNAFGEWNFATRKVKRMLYWMPKLKYSNKYLNRKSIEGKDLTAAELAGHALRMMSRDPATTLEYIQVGDAPSTSASDGEVHLEDYWIVSAQCSAQRRLIDGLATGTQVFVEGPHRVYLMSHPIQYVFLKSAAINSPFAEFENHDMKGREDFTDWYKEWSSAREARARNMHEQRDETILGLAVCSETTNHMARHWVAHLQKASPRLSEMVIRLRLDKGKDEWEEAPNASHSDAPSGPTTDAQTAHP